MPVIAGVTLYSTQLLLAMPATSSRAAPTGAGLLFHVTPVSVQPLPAANTAGPLVVLLKAKTRNRAPVTGAVMPLTLNRRRLCDAGLVSADRLVADP